MSRKNEIVSEEVSERKALWAAVRRSEPIQEIRRLMRQKELLNKDVAERLGITEAAVSRLLKGNQNIQIDTLYMLADALEEPLSISIGKEGSGCTYTFEGNNEPEIFEYVGYSEEVESNIIDLEKYRKSSIPAYNSAYNSADLDLELECA